jgi:Toxin PAAR-like domain
MPVTVGVNKLSVVHKGSNGITTAFPDVCKTPAPPAPFVPIPYPNIAKSSDTDKGASTVKCDGNPTCVSDSNFMMSTGDEAGSLLGVASNKIKGKAEFVNYSFDVKFEGKGVARALDLMLHNDKNTPPFPVVQGPVVPIPSNEKCDCWACHNPF